MEKKPSLIMIISAIVISSGITLAGYIAWRMITGANTELKIGFVTDWEYGYRKDVGDKMTNQAPAEMEKAVKYLNEEFKPELVVAGGDMIESSGISQEKAKKQLEEINGIFSRLEARREYIFGNHDLRVFSKEDLRKELGLADNHSYFDLGDWRLVMADTNFRKKDQMDMGPDQYSSGYISEKELAWLEEALNTDRPTIIFSHHSPIPNIDSKNIKDQEKIRAFLEKFPNIVLVVSGHDPSCILKESNGINYFIASNLVDQKAMGSFATIEARYNRYTKKIKIELEHHGTYEEKFEIQEKFKYKEEWKNYLTSFF